MYVVKTYDIYGSPVYAIPDVWTKTGGSLQEVKEIYTKSGGSLVKVYNRNLWGSIGQQHPFWEYNINSEFNFNDQGVSFFSFWNSPAGGSYSISSGSCTISINSLNLDSTTQDFNSSTNITNGSNIAVVKNTNAFSPVTQTNVDTGTTVRWAVSGNGIQSNTFIDAILNSTEIRLSRNATATATSVDVRYRRTWNSGYSGLTRMSSSYPLRVSPGQTYTLQAAPTSGTTSNTAWRMAVITAPLEGDSDFFGTNSTYQESSAYFDFTNNSWNVTVPSGHNWMRPMLLVNHNSTSYPSNMPRFYTFNWFRVTRAG